MPIDQVIQTLAWLRDDQTQFLHQIASCASLSFAAAGSSDPSVSQAVAGLLDAPAHFNDLRTAMTTSDTSLLVLADPADFAAEDLEQDVALLRSFLAEPSRRVFLFEPIPASPLASTEDAEALLATGRVHVPLLRHASFIRTRRDLIDTFAQPRSVHLTYHMPAVAGSLGRVLFDAVDVLHWMLGVPDHIYATIAVPAAETSRVRLMPGDSLTQLAGDMALTARYADGRLASLSLSNQAGRADISLSLLNASGRLTLTPSGAAWFAPDGSLTDESPHVFPQEVVASSGDQPCTDQPQSNGCEPPAHADDALRSSGQHTPGQACVGTSARLFADQLSLLLTSPSSLVPPINLPAVMHTAGSALLSARTGEPESPDMLRRMAGSHQ